MTKSHTLFSLLKSLWLRSTGQPGWCTCMICRDEMLNLPDPLGFSEDARKLQKRLRKMPKGYKSKPCPLKGIIHHKDEETCSVATIEIQREGSIHISPHANMPLPTPPVQQKIVKTVSFSDPLEQHYFPDKYGVELMDDEGYQRESTSSCEGYAYINQMDYSQMEMNEKKHLKVIRMLETIAETATTSAAHIAHEEHESSDVDDGYSLYEAHPPTLRFSNPVKFFHPDADSMDSYGTITSQEILEAFEKASEELLLDSFTSSVGSPPKASLDDDCLYTDLVHSASINSTHV